MTPVTWHLIGWDAEAMACDVLLQRDWRTKWSRVIGPATIVVL